MEVLICFLGIICYKLNKFFKYLNRWNEEFNREPNLNSIYGWNGYDNNYPKMSTPLIVKGPSFKVKIAQNIDKFMGFNYLSLNVLRLNKLKKDNNVIITFKKTNNVIITLRIIMSLQP